MRHTLFIPKALFFIVLLVGSGDACGMSAVASLGSSLLKSEFVKKHVRDFGVIVGGIVVVGVYKSFFSRLDRIEAMVQEIEEKINATNENCVRLDDTVRASIQNVLDKIKDLPDQKDMEKMLQELRKMLMSDLLQLNEQNNQKLFDFEMRMTEQTIRISKSFEEKLMRLEQKIEQLQAAVVAYHTDVDKGLVKIAQGQKEILNVLPANPTLKQVMQKS